MVRRFLPLWATFDLVSMVKCCHVSPEMNQSPRHPSFCDSKRLPLHLVQCNTKFSIEWHSCGAIDVIRCYQKVPAEVISMSSDEIFDMFVVALCLRSWGIVMGGGIAFPFWKSSSSSSETHRISIITPGFFNNEK